MDVSNFLIEDNSEESNDNLKELAEESSDDTNDVDISFLHDKYQKQIQKRMKSTKQNKHNDDDQERLKKQNQVNWLSIPWEGEPPNIIFANNCKNNSSNDNSGKSQKEKEKEKEQGTKISNEMNAKQIRKIWFARNMKDKRSESICIWDIPLSWNENDISNIFSMFGKIKTVSFQHTTDIIS